MPSLEYMLVTPQTLPPGTGGAAWSPVGQRSGGEAFDQMMTRAMTPAGTPEGNTPAQPSTISAAAGEGEPDASASLKQSGQTPKRTWTAANEPPTPGADGVTESSEKTTAQTSIAPVSKRETEKGGGEIQASFPTRNKTEAAADALPVTLGLLAAVLPSSLPSLLLPGLKAKGGTSEATGSTAAGSSATAGTAGSEARGAVAARSGAKADCAPTTAANADVARDKTASEWAASLNLEGRQTAPARTGDAPGGKINSGEGRVAAKLEGNASKAEAPTPGVTASNTVEKPLVHPAQAEASGGGGLGAETTGTTALEKDGISVANQSMAMNKAEKMNKVAGLTGKTEKVLPGEATVAAAGNNLPAADSQARVSALNESPVAVSGPSANGAEAVSATGTAGVTATPLVDLHTRALERTHDMVTLHAMRLVDSKSDSLSVVIKPGAGLQMSLEMRQHGDSIDIRAVLQHGDFERLNQHWPELQQRLEQRGVRLAALTDAGAATTGGDTSGFQQSQHGFASTDPLETSAFAAFALAGSSPATANASPVPGLLLHGWETWA